MKLTLITGASKGIGKATAKLFSEIELCKSIVLKGLQAIDKNDKDISNYASLAKAKLCKTVKLVTNEAIQMHGGIGFTWDNDTHLWFKRAKSSEVFLGDPAHHHEKMMTIWDA